MGKLNLTADTDGQKRVLDYLEQNASDALTEKINTGTKTMSGCWSYIREEARKKAKDNCAMIEDSEVYGWAVHFFEEDGIPEKADPKMTDADRRRMAENEERKEKERAEQEVKRKESERKLAEQAEAARKQKEREKAEREAKKAAEAAARAKEKAEKASGAVAGQISLFDFITGDAGRE